MIIWYLGRLIDYTQRCYANGRAEYRRREQRRKKYNNTHNKRTEEERKRRKIVDENQGLSFSVECRRLLIVDLARFRVSYFVRMPGRLGVLFILPSPESVF